MQAREWELMERWIKTLRDGLPARPETCCWLLSELGCSSTAAGTNAYRSLRELLLSTDDRVRELTLMVCQTALSVAIPAAGGGSGGGRTGSTVGRGRGGDGKGNPATASDGALPGHDVYRAAYEMEERGGEQGVEEGQKEHNQALSAERGLVAVGQREKGGTSNNVDDRDQRQQRRTVSCRSGSMDRGWDTPGWVGVGHAIHVSCKRSCQSRRHVDSLPSSGNTTEHALNTLINGNILTRYQACGIVQL